MHEEMFSMKRCLKFICWFILITVIAPLALGAILGFAKGWPPNWREASWASSGLLPQPNTVPQAQVIILASRTGKWKSIFAEHMSLIIKPANAATWTRYDVVGWGNPVRKNDYVADAFWYGNKPRVIYKLQGQAAEQLIPKIEASIAAYPNSAAGSYHIWPGPNSNTFISWVVRNTDHFNAELSSVAVGKDYLGQGIHMARAPSGTGYTLSWSGYLGFTLAAREGLELHLIGGTIGIDPYDLAIKLPSFGKLSLYDLAKN
jgi:Protein of unknown function (DUF3750)